MVRQLGEPVDHIRTALDDPDHALRNRLFQSTWLQQALSPAEYARVAGANPSHLRDLYPGIYGYGPHYPAFAASLPRLNKLITAELAAETQPILNELNLLTETYDMLIDEDSTYALLADNPDYAYRDSTTRTDDGISIPGFDALNEIPGLNEWTFTAPSSTIINAFILIDTYKRGYLCQDVFESLEPYQDIADGFAQLRVTWQL